VKSIKPKKTSEIPRRFCLTILDLARKTKKNSGITPAMPSGSSLKFMMDALKRAFDVGNCRTARRYAIAGMAPKGMFFLQHLPTFARWRPVIQRRSHTKLTGYFCLDIGPVGEDGGTYHGVLIWLLLYPQ
jgi:1-deoxy-D-xylulose-5-phosphate synthase